MHLPIEPPASNWVLPDPARAPRGRELLAAGADLAPGTMLAGYRHGLFPMGLDDDDRLIGWWSPDPRGILRPDEVHISRSLARSMRRFKVTTDHTFPAVVAACADPTRPHGWINPDFADVYQQLHELGWAHSVEVWASGPEGEHTLAAGLFGVEIGGLFAAESMFHHQTDASKVAVVKLCELLSAGRGGDRRIIDVQWLTPHLASLGAREISRKKYLALLRHSLELEPSFTT